MKKFNSRDFSKNHPCFFINNVLNSLFTLRKILREIRGKKSLLRVIFILLKLKLSGIFLVLICGICG